MRIVKDDLSDEAVVDLLQEHLVDVAKHSPPDSVHALDLSQLQDPTITFWTVWEANQLLGCGALQQLDSSHGEIKSMRTAVGHRGRGVASAMLTHLIKQSMRRSYVSLSLETGSAAAFAPARLLYEKFGFQYCEPFSEYREDPFSQFMTLSLDGRG